MSYFWDVVLAIGTSISIMKYIAVLPYVYLPVCLALTSWLFLPLRTSWLSISIVKLEILHSGNLPSDPAQSSLWNNGFRRHVIGKVYTIQTLCNVFWQRSEPPLVFITNVTLLFHPSSVSQLKCQWFTVSYWVSQLEMVLYMRQLLLDCWPGVMKCPYRMTIIEYEWNLLILILSLKV